MRIAEVRAFPLSFDMQGAAVTLGTGAMVKRDVVVVRVRTQDGLVGYGEAHHAMAPTVVAELVNTGLGPLLVGRDAMAVEDLWHLMYHKQGRTHGAGWAVYKAMSGIDIALWDLRGKALGQPVYRLLGGERKRLRAYAGGTCLGYQPPERLTEEALALVAKGYTAIKLRLGDTVRDDAARLRHVRRVLGDGVDIAVDINTKYSLREVMALLPTLEECNAFWVEEPFPPDNLDDYVSVNQRTRLPLAAGENHFTRYQALQLLQRGAVDIVQPDVSKAGGITEGKKIADLAAAFRRPFAPHTSMSGINAAATLHLLCATANALIYEADEAAVNPFRDHLASPAPRIVEGYVEPPEGPGLGIEVDESLFQRYPVIPGPCYV